MGLSDPGLSRALGGGKPGLSICKVETGIWGFVDIRQDNVSTALQMLYRTMQIPA